MGDHLHDPILPHTADELLPQDPFLPYTAAELLPHFVKYDPEGENQEKYLAYWLAKIAKAQGEDDPSWAGTRRDFLGRSPKAKRICKRFIEVGANGANLLVELVLVEDAP